MAVALNPFLTSVVETEEYSCNKSFSKEMSYSDKNHVADTVVTCSNSDFSFTGAVQALRHKYKNKVDYSSGFAVFLTSVRRKDERRGVYSKYASSEVSDHVAILDLSTFRDFFAQPGELAEFLLSKGKQLVSSWMEKNAGPEMVGKRRPIGVTYNLVTYPWLNSKGRKESSVYTLQLSTWGFTSNSQQAKNPIIVPNDVKVLLKLKSTTNGAGPGQSASGGLHYDSYGYGVPLLHFVGMLKSDDFKEYVSDVVETMGAVSPAEKPNKKRKLNGGAAASGGGEYDGPEE